MNDLPERLRRLYAWNGTNHVQEAADEIERLRAELADEAAIRSRMAEANNALRAEVEALRAERDVLKTGICIDPDEWPVLRRAINRMVRIAREQDHAEAR